MRLATSFETHPLGQALASGAFDSGWRHCALAPATMCDILPEVQRKFTRVVADRKGAVVLARFDTSHHRCG
jgi:hypothetical protein